MSLVSNLNYLIEKKEKKYLSIIFIGIILTTVLEIISIAAIIPVFNIIVLEKFSLISFIKFENVQLDIEFKILILSLFILIFVIKNSFIIIFNFFFIKFLYKLNTSISNRLFYLCLRQDYKFFIKEGSNNFLQKVTSDVNNTNTFLLSLINLITEIIFLFAVSIFLIFINYKIFLFCFVIFFSSIIIYYKIFKKRIKAWSISYQESSGNINNLVTQGINGIKDLIIYKLEDYFTNSFNNHSNISNKSKSKIDFLNNIQKYWLETIIIFAMTIALIYFIIINFKIDTLIPVFGLFIFALFRLLSSFSRIVIHGQSIKFYYPSYKTIVSQFQLFNEYGKDSFDLKFQFHNFIEFNKVSFFYNNTSKEVLNDISIKIRKGECIGILGNNASGKSTLLNLISGLIEPSAGEIMVDGKYNLYLNRKLWRNKISYVQQDIFLLNSSIKNNICLVDESGIDNLKFNKILNDLKLVSFFSKFPNGVNTHIINNGTNLSGGQKQIISLARALYKDSEVIILDEPSSAFDSMNSEILKKNILLLKKIKTIFFVTHDKTFFSDCFDKIIKLDAGKVSLLNN
jgi:ABC-type multidrug transport system fused ATPase/permease subunit